MPRVNLARRLYGAWHAFRGTSRAPSKCSDQACVLEVNISPSSLLKSKNVLIAGAGRNIGKGILLELGRHGANLYLTNLSEQLCRELEGVHYEIHHVHPRWFVSDIRKTKDNERVIEYFRVNRIPLDILVINAFDDSVADMARVFETNVQGPLSLISLASRMMIEQKTRGSIIVLSSIHQETVHRNVNYSSSKASLKIVVQKTAKELAPHKIRVNGIAPGYVAEDEHGQARTHRFTPLGGCSIPPRYIGRTVLYLASDQYSQHTTGTIVKVDAGLSLHTYRSHSKSANACPSAMLSTFS